MRDLSSRLVVFVVGKQYPNEPLKQHAKTRQWLLGNSIVSAVLGVIVVGLICSQIWIHLEMEDDNGSGGLQGTTEKQTTAEDTTGKSFAQLKLHVFCHGLFTTLTQTISNCTF